MRFVLLCIVSFTILSCREYNPFGAPIPIEGYRLSGKVISPNGIPLSNVSVNVLYYYYEYSATPIDSENIIIPDTLRYMDVSVFTPSGTYVRSLYQGYPPEGIFPRKYWNERDDSGRAVPSGKYLIRYEYNSVIVKETPYIVENTITAVTNASGEFTLTRDALPVGELFDIYDVDNPGHFFGAYRVTSRLRLIFTRGTMTGRDDFDVLKNSVTRRVFTLQ